MSSGNSIAGAPTHLCLLDDSSFRVLSVGNRMSLFDLGSAEDGGAQVEPDGNEPRNNPTNQGTLVQLATACENAIAKSRLVGIRSAMLTLRMMENWRSLFGNGDAAMIGLAIVAIMSERLMRVELASELESLALPMPIKDLGRCNISSIAAATGLNRETTRRKINQLIASGLIVREGNAIMLAPGFTQRKEAAEIVQTQLDELRRAANDLIRIGAVTDEGDAARVGAAHGVRAARRT
jgi:hypothetical protein